VAERLRMPPLDPCPDPEVIAAFLENRLSGPERAAVIEHLAHCDDCYVLFSESARIEVRKPTRIRPWHTITAGAVALAAAASFTLVVRPQFAPNWWPGRPALADLVAAVGSERNIEPRLTGGFAYGPLVEPSVMRSGERSEEAFPPDLRIAAIAIEKRLDDNRSASALHAHGTAQLVMRRADTAVSSFEEAVRLAPRDARYHSDLAAAYLVRFKQKNNVDDLTKAVAAARQATEREPSLPEARFNLALALEAMSRREDARGAWDTYLKTDPRSEWAHEARQHRERMGRK
jgi:tetratricopeptide (TPR) repeat protein